LRPASEKNDTQLASEAIRLDVSDGSKTEVAPLERHVRSTLGSRHRQATRSGPVRARSGSGRFLLFDLSTSSTTTARPTFIREQQRLLTVL